MAKKITYSRLQSELNSDRGDPAEKLESLYHLTGDEGFLKEEALKRVVSALVPKDLKMFNLDILYGAETSADQIIGKACTAPVGSGRRVVVVFDLHKLSVFSKDVLLSFLPKLPDSVCLILLSPKIPTQTKFYKALSGLATTVEFPKMWESQVPAWVTNRMAQQGKKIETGAVRLLQELVGSHLSELAREIDKLVIYAGENESITAAHVESVAGLSRAHTVFQLIDSIGERDCGRSLHILRNLALSGERPGGIIYWLTEHLERLILTKEFSPEKGKTLASFLRTKPFLASKYQEQARNFSVTDLEKGMVLLHKADVDLKSNRMQDRIILEVLTYSLCHL